MLIGFLKCNQSKETLVFGGSSRGERIRTSDLFVPNEARYQTAPRPDVSPSIFEIR